jgi:UrcA family protein
MVFALRRIHRAAGALAVLCGLAALPPAVHAQTNTSQTSATPESAVTVVAPRIVRHEVPGAIGRFSDAPVEVLSLAKTVSFADLDLTRSAGKEEFLRRILYASLDACNALEAQYPSNIYVPVRAENCPDRTAGAVMPTAYDIIAAANRRVR